MSKNSTAMTNQRLSKILKPLNGKRVRIAIDKTTFNHPLERDGVCIIDVNEAELNFITIADGDGFTKRRKDGTEVGRWMLVLKGMRDD